MKRLVLSLSMAASIAGTTLPAHSASIDSLRGQFTFNWLIAPHKTSCAPVDDRLMSLFKSSAFLCDMKIVKNTASGKPAIICAKKGGRVEYLVFSTKKSCELERRTQMSNGD